MTRQRKREREKERERKRERKRERERDGEQEKITDTSFNIDSQFFQQTMLKVTTTFVFENDYSQALNLFVLTIFILNISIETTKTEKLFTLNYFYTPNKYIILFISLVFEL